MPEELTMVRMCAPTLAGMKTGSLYNYRYEDRGEMMKAIRGWNRRLRARGVCLIPLRYADHKALIYLFRPEQLRCDLCRTSVSELLRTRGYKSLQCGQCLARLIERLREENDFPHEIGLFLGYPPEDVKGFIQNRAEGFKTVGYWKVYGDAEAAGRTFCKYRKCTELLCRRLRNGEPVEQLTAMSYLRVTNNTKRRKAGN
ncbi:MAG: DUF3793 family protein [Lachnospiraceae bacterium]|nr:DUF3793 family protein [Lachnospiraceae bacterium]